MHPAPYPTLFIPHGGGPCFFMDWDPPDTWKRMENWLRSLPGTLGTKPDAIVIISGHWECPEFTVNVNPAPTLLFDYSGFPPHTYQLTYPAPGSPGLAARVQELLDRAGIASDTESKRGFDHGVFVPLKIMYPEADVPIVQLSLKRGLDPATHLRAGRALAPLRLENVMILGSGMSYHNMRGFGPSYYEVSKDFDGWLTDAVTVASGEREGRLLDWQRAPAAKIAQPYPDHLLPLMVAAGAAGPRRGKRIFTDTVMGVVVSGYRFG